MHEDFLINENKSYLKCNLYSILYPSRTLDDGESNGTPPQYSCLENPMDGGAW